MVYFRVLSIGEGLGVPCLLHRLMFRTHSEKRSGWGPGAAQSVKIIDFGMARALIRASVDE